MKTWQRNDKYLRHVSQHADQSDCDFEREAYPNAPKDLLLLLSRNRNLIRRFLAAQSKAKEVQKGAMRKNARNRQVNTDKR